MNKRWMLLLLTMLLVLTAGWALCEGRDVTADCTFKAQKSSKDIRKLTDRKYATYFTLGKGSWLEISGTDVGGVYLQWYDHPMACEIQLYDGNAWQAVVTGGTHLSDWFALPEGTDRVRIVNKGKGRMYLAEVTVYSAGGKPASVPKWRDLAKCDLMLMTAHPDDEVLWFGGLLPTYAGERGLDVQVAVLVPTTPRRQLELLDSIWHCGVTAYPAFGTMRDVRSGTLKGQYKLWQKNHLWGDVTAILRQYKPDVVVTHDFRGEYGHGAHQAVADAAAGCIKLAANDKKFPKSAKKFGVWQVSKLYVHLYDKGVTQPDWHIPLTAFGDEDGLTVASEALQFHSSQVKHGWAMPEGGEYDNSLFGLYYTAVGEDTTHDDFMEHISAHTADAADDSGADPVGG